MMSSPDGAFLQAGRPATRHRSRVLTIALEVAVNFVAPVLIYDRMAPGHGDVVALLASSVPPVLWSLAEFARHRRIDALSVLVVAGIALSLVAMAGGGSARLLQLRENLVTALIGLAFLVSAAVGRPLIYQLARAGLVRKAPDEVAAFEAKRDKPRFRRVMTLMTVTWGAGLLASAALACVLVGTLSIRTYMIVSPILGYGTMGALGLWTVIYRRMAQRKADMADEAARRLQPVAAPESVAVPSPGEQGAGAPPQ